MQLLRGPAIGTLASCLALSTALTGAAVNGANGSSAQRAEAGTTLTPYGLGAVAYGSKVSGGDLPVRSGRTALSVIGCTKLAGLDKSNELVGVDLDEVDLEGVETRTWTTQATTANGVAVSSHAMTKIASVSVAGALGTTGLQIEGLRLKSRAYHDDRGFRVERDLDFDNATLNGLATVDLDPEPGAQLNVGQVDVTFLTGNQSASSNQARVSATGLRVVVHNAGAADTVVTVGNAASQINSSVPAGILGGYGRAGNVRALDGTVVSGKLAVQPLPCAGTNGVWRTNATAGLDVPGVLRVDGASGSARGDQTTRTDAYGQTRGNITRASFDNRLVIELIQAQANVTKTSDGVVKTAKGTSVGSIELDGNNVAVPAAGVTIRVGRLADITGPTVMRTPTGISVIALQVKLLDGSIGSTVHLGEAYTRIKRG